MRIVRGIAALTLALALLVSAGACSNSTSAGDEAVAVVNGEEIPKAEFERIYAQVVKQNPTQFTDEATVEGYRATFLGVLIDAALVRQEAARLGAEITDARIEEQLTAMMAGSPDQETFEQQVTDAGLTMDDLRKSIRDQLARQFLYEYVSAEASVTALPQDYSLLEHVLFATDDKATAETVLADLKAGGDFAAAAQEFSIDTGSGAQGGSLGWASTDDYVPEFKTAADALKVGEISGLVESQYGWHIIRKIDQAVAGSPIAELPAELRAMIQASGGDLAYRAYVEDLRAKAKIEILDPALQQ